jgi:hypothetical protein
MRTKGRPQMSARVYASEITAEGETMRVHVVACILDTCVDIEVVIETQNADIALEHAEEKLITAFEDTAKELRDRSLHLGP